MDNVTNRYLAQILMTPPQRAMPTALELALASSPAEGTDAVPYAGEQWTPHAHAGRSANAPISGANGANTEQNPDDEALAAQLAREGFAKRTRRSVRPEGGRKEGALTEFVSDVMIPKSPLDFAMFALSGPFRPAVKAAALGLGAALESSPAQAEIGKALRTGGGLLDRALGRFPQFATEYPKPGR